MNVLIEMTALSISRSTSSADSEQLAAWFEAKALLHAHLAAESSADRAHESALPIKRANIRCVCFAHAPSLNAGNENALLRSRIHPSRRREWFVVSTVVALRHVVRTLAVTARRCRFQTWPVVVLRRATLLDSETQW